MSDYSKGKIYTIRCKTDNNLIYVGSTIQSLAKRWSSHKKISQKDHTTVAKLVHSKYNGDWSSWYIELYENFSCKSGEELRKREGEIIREIGTLNRCIAGRTPLESNRACKAKNSEKYKETDKLYREKNKEKEKNRHKVYDENNKEKIAIRKHLQWLRKKEVSKIMKFLEQIK